MNNIKSHKTSAKIFTTATNSILVGMSCLMLTAGCSSSNNLANFTGVEPHNRNQVEMVRIPYNIHFGAGTAEMSEEEISKLNHFLRTSNVTYGDEFSMDFPLDRNGNLSELDEERLSYMSNLLKDSGIYISAAITPYGMEPSLDTGRLLISKYVITTPECGDWSQPSYPNYENAPLSNLGCASQANLGLMIANPRDLIIGAQSTSPSTERSAGAVERYRNNVVDVAPATVSGTGN